MSLLVGLKRKFRRFHDGAYTCKDIFLSTVDWASYTLTGKSLGLYTKECHRRFAEGSSYRFKDARLPFIPFDDEKFFFVYIFPDTFYSYMYKNDKYDEKTFDYCDEILYEGLYGLVNDIVNVTVEPDDVVLDVGSWIGDYAAYASAKGAAVYAFEPSSEIFEMLEKTAVLNSNIIPVKKAISDSESNNVKLNGVFSSTEASYDATTIDAFVREHNLQRVDFIKADIEGFERKMLAGAQETLARFAPKLALCTYHLPDDPQVMAELILRANPKYNIVQKRMKLFASVPK